MSNIGNYEMPVFVNINLSFFFKIKKIFKEKFKFFIFINLYKKEDDLNTIKEVIRISLHTLFSIDG